MMACFWTDLVNATQVCGDTPPDPEGPIQAFTSPPGNGSGNGMFHLLFRESSEMSGYICDPALYTALEAVATNEVDVVITKLWGVTLSAPCGSTDVWPPVWAEGPGTLANPYVMTLQEWGGGAFAQFNWTNGEWPDELMNEYFYAVEIDVGGVTYRGFLHMGNGI